jgi:probable HAF family extracellular repeat protein
MRSKVFSHLRSWSLVPLLLTGSALWAQVYTVTDIGALAGETNTIARKINLGGLAVGQSGKMYGVDTHAFLLNGAALVELGILPGGDYSSAFDINNSGDVAGESNTGVNIHGFVWDKAKGLQDLGTLPRDTGSRAFGINDADDVVGYSSGPSGVTAVSWKGKGAAKDLGTLPGGDMSQAYGINNAESIVGVSTTSSGDRHAVLWLHGRDIQDLGTLPGDITSEAHRISNGGDVIGSSSGPGGPRAVLWPRGGAIQNLGTLGGDSNSDALDLNNSGEVVGTSLGGIGPRAVYWSSNTGMVDLNYLIPAGLNIVLTEAIGISNAGRILAIGVVTTDRSQPVELDDTHQHAGPIHAFLLVPISEGPPPLLR